MAQKKLMESTLPEIFVKCVDEDADMIINATHVQKVADVLFEAVTKCLAAMKRQDRPVAFVFEELNGNFVGGAVVQYHDGGDDAGNNWSCGRTGRSVCTRPQYPRSEDPSSGRREGPTVAER